MARGVGKFRGIKIISWNKGPMFMINKLKQIKEFLDLHNPHILALSEAQIRKQDLNELHFENYKLEVDNLIHTNKIARSCILIHKDISHERIHEIEPNLKSIIVINVGLKFNKKFTVIQWYRQHQLLNSIQEDSLDDNRQKERLIEVVNMWKDLATKNETILVGDINLDSEKHTKGVKKEMLQIIEEELLQTGTTKANIGNTYFKTGSNIERAIDHIYSNKYDKLSKIEIIQYSDSDHLPIICIQNMKKIVIKKKYITVRVQQRHP